MAKISKMHWTIVGTAVHLLKKDGIILGPVLLRQDGWHAQWTERGTIREVGPFEEPKEARKACKKRGRP